MDPGLARKAHRWVYLEIKYKLGGWCPHLQQQPPTLSPGPTGKGCSAASHPAGSPAPSQAPVCAGRKRWIAALTALEIFDMNTANCSGKSSYKFPVTPPPRSPPLSWNSRRINPRMKKGGRAEIWYFLIFQATQSLRGCSLVGQVMTHWLGRNNSWSGLSNLELRWSKGTRPVLEIDTSMCRPPACKSGWKEGVASPHLWGKKWMVGGWEEAHRGLAWSRNMRPPFMSFRRPLLWPTLGY